MDIGTTICFLAFIIGLLVAGAAIVWGTQRMLWRSVAQLNGGGFRWIALCLGCVGTATAVALFGAGLWQIYQPYIAPRGVGETNGLMLLFGPIAVAVPPAVVGLCLSGLLFLMYRFDSTHRNKPQSR